MFFSRAANVTQLDIFEKVFKETGHRPKVIAEGTTEYMSNLWAPTLMAAALPNLKLIFILRSPSTRAYSAYLHLYKRGHDKRRPEDVFLGLSIENALLDERSRIGRALMRGDLEIKPYIRRYDDYLWQFRYVANSIYSEQIARYEAIFEPERLLVVIFEQALREPQKFKSRLAAFLGLDAARFPNQFPHDNPTILPQYSTIAFLKKLLAGKSNARRVPPVPLIAEPHIKAALEPLFIKETHFWSEQVGLDLSQYGW